MAEKKMKQVDFWIRYFKEHINTIGCVELDGLDCREVLALLQELADKKVDKPNKMEAVAQLFGKKLGEEFWIRDNKIDLTMYARFTERGLETKDGLFDDYVPISTWLEMLLTGEVVIVDD